MERVTIEAEPRDTGAAHALRAVRRSGKVPGILYGGRGKAVPVQVNPKSLVPIVGIQARHHTLFELKVQGGENTLAMVAETQFDPLHGRLQHIDFKRVSMDQKIRIMVPIETTGMAQGIKLQGGFFEMILREVEVECLPGDLPDQFTIDVTPLMIGQHVRVSDLQQMAGDKVKILRDPQAVVCHVVAPKVEEAKPAEAAEATAAEPEVIKKGKAEEPEEGEGAEATAGGGEAKGGKKEK